METLSALDFFRGLSIIMFIVVVFCIMYVAKYKQLAEDYRNDNLMKEDLLYHHKNVAEDYKSLWMNQRDDYELLERQNKILNDEIAKLHGRKTRQSYYADQVRNGSDDKR